MTRRMPPTETVRMALTTLRSNRLRSLLTMVGIVIGNASVITLVGVGRGAQGLAEVAPGRPLIEELGKLSGWAGAGGM